MAQVALENVSKRYGEVTAVDSVDLRVEDRELCVLVGPSGCGKTTTLRLIAGLEDVTSGQICIGGRVVNHVAPKDRNVAMVFQHYALYPHMNVFKNMAFGLRMRGFSKTEIDSRVRQAAGLLGIEDLLSRKPAALSGGQRQRVAVGRAIVRDADVFLLDEPLSDLDAQLRVAMRTELVKLQQQLAATMIHVTHDQVEAMMMGERIVVLNEGRIQQIGRPLDIYNRPANRFVAGFIGSPPMNFLDGTLTVGDGEARFELTGFTLTLASEYLDRYAKWSGRKAKLGIRPEDIRTSRRPDQGDKWQRVRAEVVVAQALGSETVLDLQCGLHEFRARAGASDVPRRGETIDVYFNAAKCLLFDPNSGDAI
ncbi:MAG: ABC transporter ATP-binding protein [Planctomycetes bacterium]|nr:ABC transporter ATP-binding protein [Planctomycetota bacterium]